MSRRSDGKEYAERARTRMPARFVAMVLDRAPRRERAYCAGILLWDNWTGRVTLPAEAVRIEEYARQLLDGEEPNTKKAARILMACGVEEKAALERVVPKWKCRCRTINRRRTEDL